MNPYFVCTQGRSGSNLLCSYLGSTCRVGKPVLTLTREKDYQALALEPSDTEFMAHFDALERETASDTDVWGLKVMPKMGAILKRYLALKGVPLPEYKWVWLRRENKIQQAISSLKAWKADQWTRTSLDEPVIDDVEITTAQIASTISRITALDFGWGLFFEQRTLRPYTVVYEHFADFTPLEIIPYIRGILNYLGVDYAHERWPSTPFKKTRTALNDDLYVAYISHYFPLLQSDEREENST